MVTQVNTKQTTFGSEHEGRLGTLEGRQILVVAASDETTTLTVGTNKIRFRVPHSFKLLSVRATLNQASSSGLVTVNVKRNGTSLFTTKVTLDVSELTSATAATPSVLTTPSGIDLYQDELIAVDVDTAGTAAAGLKLYFVGS
jgi:hypothetical protein